MNCPRCQSQNRLGVKFCEECGARLALTCSHCGAEVIPEKKFCGACGAPLAAPPAARFASPHAYTPSHLAEKILTSRSALEGERKQVTVLFADLKGSMELLADRDPEEARRLLDPVLTLLMEAVHRYEGTVNQVMGDGIMALFGAPLAHEDHAVRACYAALRMQESVKQYAAEVQRTEGIPIQIRVGVNSGEVVVRSIGSDLHMDYTAVGQTTHLAARMEQMALPGSILITADALRLAEGYVQVRALGPVQVKGLGEPVEVYEVTGAGPVRTRIQAAAARGLTRFVGRQTELEALGHGLEKSRAGHGQVVALVGEPGVGKSRLVWEFTRSHRTRGSLLLESSSVSFGKATPYLPIIDLLKVYFQIEVRDDARKIREKVTGKVLTLDELLRATLPAFLSLLDVPVEDPQWQGLDPPQRRQRTLEAVKRLLLRESQVQPVLLVFEDLHWIDSETQSLLESLVESLPTAPLLLLVNYRPEYEHGWGNKSYYTQLRLEPLPPESAGELLNALLGGDAALGPLKQLLIRRTEGNPFFLEESVRTLVETQVLVGERGAYRLAKALPSAEVPATVQAVLAARIDRLPPEAKALLQTAAVVGKDVPFALFQAIADLSEEALQSGLAHLGAAEFLYEATLFPELEYTFKHALTHEVAYGSLLHERRRALHARIVDAIERLYPNRLTEQIERLAHHALRGEMWHKAVAYSRLAGAKAFGRSANREAVQCFEQALGALSQLPESRAKTEQAIDLRFNLRSSLLPLGEFGRMFDHLREAEAVATALGDQSRLGQVLSFLANYFYLLGAHDRAIASARRALAIAETLGDLRLRFGSNLYLGQAYYALGDYRRSVEFLRKNVESMEGDLARERLGMAGLPVVSRSWLAWSLTELGEFAEAMVHAQEAVRLAEAADRAGSLIVAYFGIVYPHFWKGEFQKAISVGERGLAICETGNFPLLFPIVGMQLGYAYAVGGRPAEAIPLLERAAEQSAAIGVTAVHSLQLAFLGEAYLLTGRLGDALTVASRALSLSREHRERGQDALVLRLLGEVACRQVPPEVERAADDYRLAVAMAEELGMRPLLAHCHLGLGRLYRRAGKPEQAREHLTTAAALFGEMEIRLWLEKAQAELGALG